MESSVKPADNSVSSSLNVNTVNNTNSSSLILPVTQTSSSSFPLKKVSLQAIIEHWKAINLEGRKNELDHQASEIADNKDNSLNQRKKLAEQTKTFRKCGDDEKLKTFGALLKFYQEEIDRLTKRSKFAETAFLGLYRLLAEAPDPLNGLLAVNSTEDPQRIQRISELELENRKLRTELEEFRKEFQGIQNQEVTIRRLEEKIQVYESKMDLLVEEKVQTSVKLVKNESQKQTELFREKEYELERRIQQQEEELTHIQQQLEHAQNDLIEARQKYDEKLVARQSELDLILEELERSRGKIISLENEKEKLLQKIQERESHRNEDPVYEPSSATSSKPSYTVDLELELVQKDTEIVQLKGQLQQLESVYQNESNSFRDQVANLTLQLEAEFEKVSSLQKELQERPLLKDYRGLQDQIQILRRALEYTDPIDDTAINETFFIRTSNGNGNSSVSPEQYTVEKLLKERNRKLETEIMLLKDQLQKMELEFQETQQKLSQSELNRKQLLELIQKLEEDIIKHCPFTTNGLQTQMSISGLGGNVGIPASKAGNITSSMSNPNLLLVNELDASENSSQQRTMIRNSSVDEAFLSQASFSNSFYSGYHSIFIDSCFYKERKDYS